MPSMPSFVSIGETMIQLVPNPLVSLEEALSLQVDLGGAESNVAIHLAQLGMASEWVGDLGDDVFGRRIVRALRAAGVNTDDVRLSPDARTGIYFKDVGALGTTVHYFRTDSAASRMGPEVWDRLSSSTYSGVHLTGVTAALSESCYRLLAVGLAERPLPSATYSFDVNFRPQLWSASSAAPSLLELGRLCDTLFVGRDEAAILWGTETAVDIRGLFPSVPSVIVKDGSQGATAFVGERQFFSPSLEIDVIEPIGAGDAFAAGYLAAYAIHKDPLQSVETGHRVAAETLRVSSDIGETSPMLLKAPRARAPHDEQRV
jgi:2-dehydro-3-deoxygluconokinase